MIGKLYINELSDRDSLIDLSTWPSQILDSRNPYGFAFGKTVQHLGIKRHDIDNRTLILSGSTETVLSNVDTLIAHTGLVARCAAERSDYWRAYIENNIGHTLLNLTQKFLPIVPKSFAFTQVVELVAAPFAESANNDNEAFRVIHGQDPCWVQESPTYRLSRQVAIDRYLASPNREEQ